ncbi:YncE family protein [Pendulispora rubella]|uniref:YncE family protein n=1 Tax=Pendulispora rubella TaxID=2741070 RepID=A0ABZ2L624_9BACT
MKTILGVVTTAILSTLAGCSSSSDPGPGCQESYTVTSQGNTGNLKNRAYVASRDSGNITVIDLDTLEIVGSANTCSRGYHMAELSADFTKIYASSTDNGKIDVLNARSLNVSKRISVGADPSHLSLSRDGSLIAVVDEKDNAVSFIDPKTDVEVKRLSGFYTPHFVRFSADNRHAYVANMGAYHITRVDLPSLAIDGEIALDGHAGPPVAPAGKEEFGFADAQIDENGVLWAAHAGTGQVLLYDTKTRTKLPEIRAGENPWIVYAEHPFKGIEARIVPNHRDRSVSLLHQLQTASADTIVTEEPESYGVNYTPLDPGKAFVMNRMREEIAVIDTRTKKRTATIPVGGNTETASTTADGKYVIAAVSSANRVVVIDAVTNAVVKTFDNVGNYPWTVTIPQGQNYCH